ncbi:MAG: hypothetical protein Q9190_001348 [Brigantiaea leucoxantha]
MATTEVYEEDLRRVITLNPTRRSVDVGRASKTASKGLVASRGNGWFDSPIMSRQHGVLRFVDDHVELEDTASTHGTFIGDRKLENGEKHSLKSGDVICFGATVTSGPVTYHARSFITDVFLRPWNERDVCPNSHVDRSISFRVPVENLDSSSDDSDDDGIQVLNSRPKTFSVPSSDDESDEDPVVRSSTRLDKRTKPAVEQFRACRGLDDGQAQGQAQSSSNPTQDVIDMVSDDEGPDIIKITPSRFDPPRPVAESRIVSDGNFSGAEEGSQDQNKGDDTDSSDGESEKDVHKPITPPNASTYTTPITSGVVPATADQVESQTSCDAPSTVFKQTASMPVEDGSEFAPYYKSRNEPHDMSTFQTHNREFPPSPLGRQEDSAYSPSSPQIPSTSSTSPNYEAEDGGYSPTSSPSSMPSPSPKTPAFRAPSPSDAALARRSRVSGRQAQWPFITSPYTSLNNGDPAFSQASVFPQSSEIHRPSNMPGYHSSYSNYTDQLPFAPPVCFSGGFGVTAANQPYCPGPITNELERLETGRINNLNWFQCETSKYSDGPFMTNFPPMPSRPASPMQKTSSTDELQPTSNAKSCVVKLRIDPLASKTADSSEATNANADNADNGVIPSTTAQANSTQESRVNISNLVNAYQDTSRGLKRKADCMSAETSIEQPSSESQSNSPKDTITQFDLLPDAQARDGSMPAKESLSQESWTSKRSDVRQNENVASIASEERHPKRSKTSAAATNGMGKFISGIFVGFAGAFALISAIPSSLYEDTLLELGAST